MKKMMLVLAIIILVSFDLQAHRPADFNSAGYSFRFFRETLAPYGEWINTSEYGFAWRPYLGNNEEFMPYSTRGNWVYTGLGWTWVSGYPWGWATFHYGRWYYDDYLGWMWIPGNEWAPAWVTWASYDDCWAWAPMGPYIEVNVNINWHPPVFWWTVVPRTHFCDDNWYAFRYNRALRPDRFNCIAGIYHDNYERSRHNGWYYGPGVRDVERHAGTRVPRRELTWSDRPGNRSDRNDRVPVYRPDVTERSWNDHTPKPPVDETGRVEAPATRNDREAGRITREAPEKKPVVIEENSRSSNPGRNSSGSNARRESSEKRSDPGTTRRNPNSGTERR